MNTSWLLFLSLPTLILGQKVEDPSQCSIQPVRGLCDGSYGWYFNRTKGACQSTYNRGLCGSGLFRSFMDCEHKCTCNMPQDPGHCNARPTTMYFFNSEFRRCETFEYSGCGGNANRFATLTDCVHTCICTQPVAVGTCAGTFLSFYFNAKRNRCESFTYSGCGGNVNRFDSLASCNDECVCNMWRSSGGCDARGYRLRFYYDVVDKTCKGFAYTGCQGNGNRFRDLVTCRQTCGGSSALPPIPDFIRGAFSPRGFK